MPKPLEWTPAQDAELLRRRVTGETWGATAAAMQLARNTVISRARALGVAKQQDQPADDVPLCQVIADGCRVERGWGAREALRAGNAEAWALICAGTCLEGVPYHSLVERAETLRKPLI